LANVRRTVTLEKHTTASTLWHPLHRIQIHQKIEV